MDVILQLELNLWDQLKQAEAAPTSIAFEQLLLCFDQELDRMNSKEKLEQGAKAIQQLADLLAMRADCLFDEWSQRFDPSGPVLAEEDTSDFVRQTFNLELDDYIADREPAYRIQNDNDIPRPLFSEISKDDLLELLEDFQVNSRSLDIQKLEYDESVSGWIAVVRSWLEATGGGQAELFQVIEGTGLDGAAARWV